ncbi:MAG TPA: hypothetical protein PLH94_01605 [Fimbriimonadaceae bacterium]|nr:hypothetical protein [Fimbriimonadaceae bacterium]
MKRLIPFVVLGVLSGAAHSQMPNPVFASPLIENYDSMVAGLYAFFPAMSGFATANAITGAPMDVGSFTFLPPFNGTQCMYGIQSDVAWRFNFPLRRFGGRWRSAATWVTGLRMRFFTTAGAPWFTSPVLPITTTSWQWYGYFLFTACGSVIIEGVPSPGFVGHDNTRARWW